MSILVVDDNSLLLSKIVRSLIHSRRDVRSAGTLAQARAALNAQRPQVLCLDLQLPDGNGFELIEELRGAGSDLPVVVISGHHEDGNRARAAALGVAGFLAKPFSLHALNALLDALLPDPGTAQGDPTPPTLPPGEPLPASRLASAKRGFTTRRADLARATRLITADYVPRPGDLLLARVDRPRQHGRIELPSGRRAWLVVGDEIIVTYGNRYAPDQFEAEVPGDLGPCHLVAAGGLAARALSRHAAMKPATEITPLGVLADDTGSPLNLDAFALEPRRAPAARPPVVGVLGTSMNAGKTTVAADLAIGLRRCGLRVGSAKVTGTGAGCDAWRLLDAGAERVLDFTDAGYASTFHLDAATCESILDTLVAELADTGVDVILVEVADGVLQAETRALALSATFARVVDNLVFAAGDALGGASGVAWLMDRNLPVVALAGLLTASPLAMREARQLVHLPVVSQDELRDGLWLPPCLDAFAPAALWAQA